MNNDDIILYDTGEVSRVTKVEKQTIKTFDLVPPGSKVLHTKLNEFDFTNPPTDPNELASTLVETCKKNNGLGLSANQCGYSYRVFVMGAGDEFISCFNPKILASSVEESMIAEGCLSFPMLALKVSRPKEIQVEYYDWNGEKHETTFSGMTAHIFQHELDHLDGICYTDRAKPMALKMGLKKRKKFNDLVDRYNKANQKIQSTTNI